MRLYHFINKHYGLKDLREKRLKIARIMELNDPFEFLGVGLSDSKLRKAMETIKQDIANECGLLCFSKSWGNPVQWSHYADGHQGLCLGFDVLDKFLDKINYVDERLPTKDFLDAMKVLSDKLAGEMGDDIDPSASPGEFKTQDTALFTEVQNKLRKEAYSDAERDFGRKIIATKFSHWSYEKEYRLFVSLKTKESDDLYYADFSDELTLKEVIVGVRSSVTRTQIEDALGEIAGSVEIFKVCEDFRKFAVVRDENNAF